MIFLTTSTPNLEVVWVSAETLEELWKLNTENYISNWTGHPKNVWFMGNADTRKERGIPTLILAEMTINLGKQPTITIIHNRHRTRWLIQNGFNEIPIGLSKFEINYGRSIDLVNIIETNIMCKKFNLTF